MAGKAKGKKKLKKNKPQTEPEEAIQIPLSFDQAIEGLLSVKPKQKKAKQKRKSDKD